MCGGYKCPVIRLLRGMERGDYHITTESVDVGEDVNGQFCVHSFTHSFTHSRTWQGDVIFLIVQLRSEIFLFELQMLLHKHHEVLEVFPHLGDTGSSKSGCW